MIGWQTEFTDSAFFRLANKKRFRGNLVQRIFLGVAALFPER